MAWVARQALTQLQKRAFQPVRCCSWHKPPFLETLEKPVPLEGPNAPKWSDDNEEFWSKAEEYVKDQPEAPVPWDWLKWIIGMPVAGFILHRIFLVKGGAGRPWISKYINQDKYLMFGLDRDYISDEDRALIAARYEEAVKQPLITRLLEIAIGHPDDVENRTIEELKQMSRVLMANIETNRRRGLLDDHMYTSKDRYSLEKLEDIRNHQHVDLPTFMEPGVGNTR